MPDFRAGSEVTLVNVESIIELIFAKASVINTTLLYHNEPYLKVSTNDIASAVTTITDVQANQLLVTIKRRDFRSDIITFTNLYGGKSVNIKDWMRERKLTNERQVQLHPMIVIFESHCPLGKPAVGNKYHRWQFYLAHRCRPTINGMSQTLIFQVQAQHSHQNSLYSSVPRTI